MYQLTPEQQAQVTRQNAEADVRLPVYDETQPSYELLWDSSWERPDSHGGGLVSGGQVVTLAAASMQIYRVR